MSVGERPRSFGRVTVAPAVYAPAPPVRACATARRPPKGTPNHVLPRKRGGVKVAQTPGA